MQTLRPYQKKRDAKKAAKEKVSQQIMRESSIIYDGPEGRIIVPHTKEASIFWGQQTRWCISATKSRNYFNDYNDEAPIYMFFPNPSEAEIKHFEHYSSWKFAGTHNNFFNEEDDQISDLHPCLINLIDAASDKMDFIVKEHFYRHGSFKHLRKMSLPDAGLNYIDHDEALLALQKNPMNHRFISDELKSSVPLAVAAYKIMAEAVGDLSEVFPLDVLENKDFAIGIITKYPELDLPQETVKACRDNIKIMKHVCSLNLNHLSQASDALHPHILQHLFSLEKNPSEFIYNLNRDQSWVFEKEYLVNALLESTKNLSDKKQKTNAVSQTIIACSRKNPEMSLKLLNNANYDEVLKSLEMNYYGIDGDFITGQAKIIRKNFTPAEQETLYIKLLNSTYSVIKFADSMIISFFSTAGQDFTDKYLKSVVEASQASERIDQIKEKIEANLSPKTVKKKIPPYRK